ncbi:MAG: tRNA pseudouridine(38-40) synthase TruA [Lentisphaeria bacterium]|nr:tRNA pseudouridine(38-40) synthase TruA [Lentisphaeria bacterium]
MDNAAASNPGPQAWHLTLAYDGTDFRGWQVQPGLRTVQGELQDRLRRLLGDPGLRLSGASRTDAGVHALDQHASFPCQRVPETDGDRIRQVLNRWLPADIQVLSVREEAADFNVRFANRGKAYTYCVATGERLQPLFARYAWRLPGALDLEAMRAAAEVLEGEHDFASFAVNPRREIDSSVRRVFRIDVVPLPGLVCFSVVGDRFLYRMVRSLVGYLCRVGQGRRCPEETSRVLAAADRGAAADSAPPEGLFLAQVFFSDAQRLAYTPLLPPFTWQPEGRSVPQPPAAAPAARGNRPQSTQTPEQNEHHP